MSNSLLNTTKSTLKVYPQTRGHWVDVLYADKVKHSESDDLRTAHAALL